ncbi:MAG: carboxypeptidase-like regulatory domain-containing protein, partial [Phaeodactylibacter sp.]|nr:carboxypeptidase-like regulatory domain-containing protein [Phaeodactylibacter sp.]
MKKWLFLACLFATVALSAQTPITQTIRGTVVDQESRYPLIGVNVIVQTEDGIIGSTTDIDGTNRLEKVPLGRQTVEFTYISYEPVIISNLILNSGKEVILDVEMEESAIQMEEVVVVGQRSGDARNEMALISARQFSVEETDRY